MSKISITGAGLVVAILTFGLPMLGINVTEQAVGEFVDNVLKVAAFIAMIYGQVRRPDLIAGIIRK